jgi:predicted transcriptional regulator
MARHASSHPTDLELEILKVLWKKSPLGVREVQEELAIGAARRELARTSVITMMNIMHQKGYLNRRKAGNSFRFSPKVTDQEVNRGMLGDLVERVFDGSARNVVLELLESSDIAPDELVELRRLIGRKVKEKQQ